MPKDVYSQPQSDTSFIVDKRNRDRLVVLYYALEASQRAGLQPCLVPGVDHLPSIGSPACSQATIPPSRLATLV
jgi:hypothetical protein